MTVGANGLPGVHAIVLAVGVLNIERGNASRHHAKVVSPRRAEPATRIHVV